MITCDKTKELLSQFMENELAPDLRQTMETHLAGCRQCQKLVDNLSFLRQRLHTIKPLYTSSQFDQQLRQKISGSLRSKEKEIHIPVQKISYGFSGIVILAVLYFFIFTDVTSTSNPVPEIYPPAASNPVNPAPIQPDQTPSMANEQSEMNPSLNDTLNPQQGKIDQDHIKLIEQ